MASYPSAWGGGYTSPLSAPPPQYGGASQYGNPAQQSQTFAQQNYQPLSQPQTPSSQQQQGTSRPSQPTGYSQPASNYPTSANYYQPQNPSQQSQSAPSGQPSQYQTVANWYQQFLGRTPSAAEVQQQLHNYTPEGLSWQNLSQVQYNIQNSPEAQAYRAQAAQAAAAPPPGSAPGAYVPPAGTDFNGYAAPGYVANPASRYALPGFDATKWNDPTLQDPKYVVGRILSNYPPTPQGLQQAMADIVRAYPGTQLSGKDTLLVPGLNEPVDVLKGAGSGGQAWQWLTPSQVAANAAGQQPMDPTMQALQLLSQQLQMPALAPQQQGGDYSALQSQIAQLLSMFQAQQQQQQQSQQAASLAARTPQVNYW